MQLSLMHTDTHKPTRNKKQEKKSGLGFLHQLFLFTETKIRSTGYTKKEGNMKKFHLMDTAYLKVDYLNISAQSKITCLHNNIIWIGSSKRAQETAQTQDGKLLI